MCSRIPWEIRLTLRCGTVYYFRHRALSSAEPHYFVVANSDPHRDGLLLLAVASSRVGSVRTRRRSMPAETVVEVGPEEYDEFRVPSVVDCNRVFRKSLMELVEDWRHDVVEPKKDMPPDALQRIRAGILASPMVEEESKRLIR